MNSQDQEVVISTPHSTSADTRHDETIINEIESLKVFFEHRQTAVVIVDASFRAYFWNNSFSTLTQKKNSIGTIDITKSINGILLDDLKLHFDRCLVGIPLNFKSVFVGYENQAFPIKVEVTKISTLSQQELFCVLIEIEDAQNEARSMTLLERVYKAMDGPIDGYWEWDLENNVMIYSPGFELMLGFDSGDFDTTVEEWKRRIHPDDIVGVEKEIVNCLTGAKSFYRAEHRLRCKDGRYMWILDRGSLIRHHSGKPLKMLGLHTALGFATE